MWYNHSITERGFIMKKYNYSCDGGSLLLGNENFQCAYMNNYGDGTHKVFIKNKEDKWSKLPYGNYVNDAYHFEGSVQGKFNVYAYDCLHGQDLLEKENILITLSGRYGIYSVKHSGDMVIEFWGD